MSDPESPFDVGEIDEDVERLPARSRSLGPLGQLLATLLTVAALGVVVIGVGLVLSWLFH